VFFTDRYSVVTHRFSSSCRHTVAGLLALGLLGFPPVGAAAQGAVAQNAAAPELRLPRAFPGCTIWALPELPRNPTAGELRCRYGIHGPGRFGMSEYMEAPVYQPATPLPGTHSVGVPGLPAPWRGESYEEWEWRVLRTSFGPEVRNVYRDLELLDPIFASRLMQLEQYLREAGVRFVRRETWRSPQRQAYLFQQGRSRPGPMVTGTLTSSHTRVDARGVPASRAADYTVPRALMQRFHEIAWAVGLATYGPDSNDPGHVYLAVDDFPAEELVFLRLLPRVPSVTIATGRPTDEYVSRWERAEWRRASEEFVSAPFLPYPTVRLAGSPPPIAVLTEPPAALAALAVRSASAQIVEPSSPRGGAIPALLRWLRGSR
jgi:hypothetical protein